MTTDRDVLISRIIDAEASDSDWSEFRALAKQDDTAWRDLAEAQHDAADLGAAVRGAIAIADDVDVLVEDHLRVRFQERIGSVATWGGWLAAAALALAWITQEPVSRESSVGDVNMAGLGLGGLGGVQLEESTPDDAFAHYVNRGMEMGVVVQENPAPVLLRMVPLEGGAGYEVLFLRQVIERRKVKDLYRFGFDEFGQPQPVRIEKVVLSGGPV